MPIRRDLASFWWFREGRVGGMAQPGWNGDRTHLTPPEDTLRALVAKLASESVTPDQLDEHLDWMRDVVAPLLDIPSEQLEQTAATLRDPDGLTRALDGLRAKTRAIDHFEVDGAEELSGFEVIVSRARIRADVAALEAHGFTTLVSLVEYPPHADVLASGLDVHHIPVEDVTPPAREQAEAFAEILETIYTRDGRLVVHCMAGIGRTTTMLVAGHLLLRGERLGAQLDEIARNNPYFRFRGSQAEFLEALDAEIDESR